MLRTSALLVTCALAVSLSAACTLKNNAALAQDASGAEDVNATESDIESLGSSFITPDGASVATAQSWTPGSGDFALQDNGSQTTGNPGFFFQPAGCLQVTVDKLKEQASYVFAGCTGPLGLVELNGTVNVSWSTSGGALTVDFSAADFKINRATITQWSATAVVTANGAARELKWTGMLSGTTGAGRPFQRTNDKDLKWTVGVECLSISGQSTGNILKANLQTTIVDYQRCADSCPQAGSEIQVKNLDNGDSIDIKYAGGPTATLTLNGKSEPIGLACGE
jgi:hypothetical protein